MEGDPVTKITGAASLAEATVHEISFFNNPRYLPQLRKTRAAAVIVPPDFSEQIGAAVIRADCHQVRAADDKICAGNSSERGHSSAGKNGRWHFHSTVRRDRSGRAY